MFSEEKVLKRCLLIFYGLFELILFLFKNNLVKKINIVYNKYCVFFEKFNFIYNCANLIKL